MHILLDTSFRENYCYIKNETMQDICNRWDIMITNIEQHLTPQKFELIIPENILDIDTPLNLIEVIGFRNDLPKTEKIDRCFPLENELLDVLSQNSLRPDFEKLIDQKIEYSFNNLVELFESEIDIELLIKMCEKKLQYDVHPQVKILKNNLKNFCVDLKRNKKESDLFKQICRDLAWDALIKRPWVSDKEQDENKKNKTQFFEEILIVRLLAYYFDLKDKKDYLPGSPLLIIYERLSRGEDRKKISPYYSNQEKIDTYMTDYAFTGYYNEETQQKEKVVVLTCDVKKGIQRKRVAFYSAGKKKLDQKIAQINREHIFEPGYIICIDKNIHQVADFIDIANEF